MMSGDLESWLIANYGQEIPKPGLERIGHYLQPLLPDLNLKKITIIAGTNGKGEVTHRLSSAFNSYCTWTSPHIDSLTERFRSEEGDISLSKLQQLIQRAHQIVQEKNIPLTYYEFLFFVFCLWAQERNPDFLFLEVGLGGRLDAVNVFDADLVLLPSLSRDHQEILGNRYEKILHEKLGVLRAQSQLISFLDLRYLNERVGKKQKDLGFSWLNLSDLTLEAKAKLNFTLRNQLLAYAGECFLKEREFRSVDCVFDEEKLKFRGEMFESKHRYFFYGSHNVDGLRKLIQILNNEEYNKETSRLMVVAFSKRSQKDLSTMMSQLLCLKNFRPIVTSFHHPKAADSEIIKSLAEMKGLEFVSDIKSELDKLDPTDIYLCGSYYFMSFFRKNFC